MKEAGKKYVIKAIKNKPPSNDGDRSQVSLPSLETLYHIAILTGRAL